MTKKQPWILGVLVILVLVIGIYFFRTHTTELFSRQQACSQLLTDFQTRWENEFKQDPNIQFFENQPGWDWQDSFQNFFIGYSPSLNVCVGGFSVVSTSAPCEQQFPNSSTCNNVTYSIINVSTNQVITPNPDSEADFQAKLSALTEGQI